MRRRAHAGGFTLLEMIVVLALAAMLVAVATPHLGPAMATLRLRGAANDIASALRHTRGLAMRQGREAVFTLHVTQHYYRVEDRATPYALPEAIHIKLFTAAQELVDAEEGHIRFYPDGSATGGRITLTAGRQRRLVDVAWLTGDVTVREERGD